MHLASTKLRLSCFCAALMLCNSGCWLLPKRGGDAAHPTADADAAKSADAAASAANNSVKATPAELAAMMAEVQQLGVLDPAAQNALLDDLKKTDPSLWPQLMQTFRASVAYRRQAEERARLAQQNQNQPGGIRQAGYTDGQARNAAAATPPTPPAELADNYPDTRLPQVSLISAKRSEQAAADDWHAQLSIAIQALEAKTATGPDGKPGAPLTAADQAILRMLYLAAGRRDDAVKTLSNATPADQEFWSEELFGLATALDEQQVPDASRRAAEAVQHLRDAAGKLGQTAALVVRNLSFCTEVTSYGVFKPFEKYEFKPGEQVILYAEIDNFTSQSTDKGFHTAMHSSYQIFDSRGAKVSEQDYAVTEEVCRNPRRDFFIRYFVYMPKRIYDGNYTLQLTIEDTQGKKIGQSSIQFAIVGAD
jgi:hypothetical protein